MRQARRLHRRGELDDALRLYGQAVDLYEQIDASREVAIARGGIADVLLQRGELDETLRIRREEELPVYKRLGDVRSTVITWGKIGDILYQRGQLDDARELQERRLAVHREMSDIDGIAAALWDLARLDLAVDDPQAAAPRLAEAWPLLVQLRRPDGIAVVGDILGQMLLAADHDQAAEVLRRSSAAYRQLGRDADADRLDQLLHNNFDDEQSSGDQS